MRKFLLLFVFGLAVLNSFAQQAVRPDAAYAGTIWYDVTNGRPDHDSFIRFDKDVAICTVVFMGGGKPSEIYDFLYNKNDKNELLLCNLEAPMRPVVILTIHEDNTLEFNLTDLPVGNKYKKIQYSEAK